MKLMLEVLKLTSNIKNICTLNDSKSLFRMVEKSQQKHYGIEKLVKQKKIIELNLKKMNMI